MKKLLNVSLFLAVLILGVALLVSRLIDGTAFVAFFVSGCLGVSVYALLPSITEFSIGGNSVKFQEKLNEAERITDELKKLKSIAVKTTLKSLKMQQKANLLVYQNLLEFRDIYQLLSDTKEFETDYQGVVMETALALRENVFDFVDLEIEGSKAQWSDWRDKYVREYIKANTNQDSRSSRAKMSIRFANQYLYLSGFIDDLSEGGTSMLKIISREDDWHMIMKGTTWKGL
ncbi:ABC-2 transporter permease [Yersinia frederiksenii]|uniref:hypothetical protein n=1 Tax=Yersinia frederiksenii TaxID=29484 RepID=UPI00119F9D2A|nr:hypothetical protein [Yersinia frederiksenii]